MTSRSRAVCLFSLPILLAIPAAPAMAQSADEPLRQELRGALELLRKQNEVISRQEERIRALEARMAVADPRTRVAASEREELTSAESASEAAPGAPARGQQAGLERVGEAPDNYDRPVEVAVLGDQGSVITRSGQLTAEAQFEYARADRNRALFRGIEVVESVLVGVFDINESRQDVLTAAASIRYGITDRFELGVRLPFVRRSDAMILSPVAGSTPDDTAATIDNGAKGSGIGDLEVTARYQLTNARGGWPFLIANLQAVFPTGRGPFEVERDSSGRALEAATGGGFYAISPSITAILPTDPVVLFGTLGYTYNIGRSVDTRIPPVLIDRVDPGDAVSFSSGVGIAFNQRVSVNLGYAHSWAFGTQTTTRNIEPRPDDPGSITRTSRDLQIGRFLFGVTYRMTDKASLNWSVEVGATEDAPDLRTVLRIPLVLLRGS